MAQINFPAATANGQEFEADNGVIYTYVGTPPNGYWSGTFQNQSYSTLDGRYLKLDSSNDPVTNGLNITGGNVGIGTTSPDAKFEVVGNSYFGATNDSYVAIYDTAFGGSIEAFDKDDSSTKRALFLNAFGGRVGIGTETPLGNLEVRGSGFVSSHISSDTTNEAQLRFETNVAARVSNQSDAALIFETNATERMRITNNGKVGIGSNSPSEKLVLAEVAEPTGFSDTALSMIRSNYGGRIAGYLDQGVGHGITFDTIDNATPTERMRISGNGNVGIGNTDPESALSINTGGTLRLGAQEDFMISGQPIGALYFGNTTNPSGGIECDWQGANNPTVAIGVTRDKSTGNLLKAQTRYQYDASIRNLINEQEVMRIQSGGLAMASGKSIVFNNNTPGLDDYEEGSFTPTLTDVTNYKYRDGHYTKIGDMVYFYIRVQANASSPSGSPWQISGLPFQSANLDAFGGAWRSYGRNVQQNQVGDSIAFHIPKNSNGIFAKVGAGVANVATNNSNHVILNEQIILNGFYKATAS